MAIEWRASAFKHYPQADAQHAIANRVLVVPAFDTDTEDGTPFDLIVGPARDGRMLEVFINRTKRPAKVFHVLHLKPKTRDRARAIIEQRKGEIR